MIGVVVRGADELPEVPGARVVVIPEGGSKPAGFTRVLFRVHVSDDSACPWWWSPLPRVSRREGWGYSVLMVAP
jgi:hypothetical protein